VPETGLSVLFGASGSFKSFVALDWALRVASGLPWLGHKVKPRPIVYVAAEGSSGLKARAYAWWVSRGKPDMSRARWLAEAVDLRDGHEVRRVRQTLDGLPETPGLLVIDTMARTMVGGDENSARDVGEFIHAVDGLRHDGAALIVHHSGHEVDRERGSTALRGAADLRVKVERRGLFCGLSCEKLKDAEEWAPIELRIEPQEAGSCVLSLVQTSDAKVAPRADRGGSAVADHGARTDHEARCSRRCDRPERSADAAIPALLDAGLIVRSREGLRACPDERGTPGHAPIAAPPGGSVPRGEKEDEVLPRWGTLSEAAPGARAPELWAPSDDTCEGTSS